MMMRRHDPNIPTCRSCFWFCYERNNVGKCGNREKMAVDGIYTASTFLRDCVWIDDGTPCGRLMNMEVQ